MFPAIPGKSAVKETFDVLVTEPETPTIPLATDECKVTLLLPPTPLIASTIAAATTPASLVPLTPIPIVFVVSASSPVASALVSKM